MELDLSRDPSVVNIWWNNVPLDTTNTEPVSISKGAIIGRSPALRCLNFHDKFILGIRFVVLKCQNVLINNLQIIIEHTYYFKMIDFANLKDFI